MVKCSADPRKAQFDYNISVLRVNGMSAVHRPVLDKTVRTAIEVKGKERVAGPREEEKCVSVAESIWAILVCMCVFSMMLRNEADTFDLTIREKGVSYNVILLSVIEALITSTKPVIIHWQRKACL